MDIEGLSTDQLEAELLRFERVRRQATAVMIALLGEADRRQVPLADGCRTLSEWAAGRLDLAPEEADTLSRLSRRLGDLPRTHKQLAEGEIGVARAETVSRVATDHDEADWLDRLRGHDIAGTRRVTGRHRRLTRDQERRLHDRSYLVIQPSLDESWWKLHGALGTVAGQVVADTLATKADQYPVDAGDRTHRQALALEALCLGDGPAGSGSGPDITVFVDWDTAHRTGGETGAELAAGPRIGPALLEELLCQGQTRIVGLSDGKPVTTTPATRTIPPAIRRYVLYRDGACRAPGCQSTHRLQPHHITPRSHGGNHHPDNLLTLCWYHHHIVIHRRGYQIQKQADGTIRLQHPTQTRDPP